MHKYLIIVNICSKGIFITKVCAYYREYKDMLDLRDPMVNPVTLETVVHQELRDNVERRAIEV